MESKTDPAVVVGSIAGLTALPERFSSNINTLVIASILFCIPSLAWAEQSTIECVATASSDYYTKKQTITSSNIEPTVESVIAQRRALESACRRYALCFSSDTKSLAYQGNFVDCIRIQSEHD